MNKQIAGCYATPIEKYPQVNEVETLGGALRKIKESLHAMNGKGAWRGHRLAVVVNKKGEPVGLVTIKNLLKAIQIKKLIQDPFYKAEFAGWYYLEQSIREGKMSVKDIMRPIDSVNLDFNSSIYQAARVFSRHGINELPVLCDDKVYGFVNARELFYACYEMNKFNIRQEPEIINSEIGKLAKGYATV